MVQEIFLDRLLLPQQTTMAPGFYSIRQIKNFCIDPEFWNHSGAIEEETYGIFYQLVFESLHKLT